MLLAAEGIWPALSRVHDSRTRCFRNVVAPERSGDAVPEDVSTGVCNICNMMGLRDELERHHALWLPGNPCNTATHLAARDGCNSPPLRVAVAAWSPKAYKNASESCARVDRMFDIAMASSSETVEGPDSLAGFQDIAVCVAAGYLAANPTQGLHSQADSQAIQAGLATLARFNEGCDLCPGSSCLAVRFWLQQISVAQPG